MIGLIGLATLWTLAGGSAAAQEDEPVYTITVLVQDRGEGDERTPIPGVSVAILDASGAEVGLG